MSKPLFRLILIGLMLLAYGCASKDELPQPSRAQPPSPSKNQPKVPSNVPSMDNRSTFVPPRGAKFTIFAGKIEGDMHVQRALNVRDTLKTSTKMPDWYVIHEEQKSLLYYGYYPAIDDPKARQDRQKIDLMRDPLGNRPFQQALMVEINSPDPSAPPEWDLTNANGFWTLQIAVYKGTPERKQAAVDTVRAARQENIEAYYFHGETASIVCVGTWPQGAVKASNDVRPARGTDRNQRLLVVPNTNDPELNRRFEEAAAQQNLQLIRQETSILDPTLEAAIQRFPRNHVNGMEMKRMVNGQEVYEHSLIVQIPSAAVADAAPAAPGARNTPAYAPGYRPEIPRPFDPPVVQPGSGTSGGRLRSFGD